jgi:hypothetical protein
LEDAEVVEDEWWYGGREFLELSDEESVDSAIEWL